MRPLAVLLLAFAVSIAALAQQRFDFKVRENMFAGMDGDTVAFERAMKLIADILVQDPDHAEALVWRGAGAAHRRAGYAVRAEHHASLPEGRRRLPDGLR